MAATPESKVKKQVVAALKAIGAYYFYPVTGGYGRSGVPDIVACVGGLFVGIECKAGNAAPTPLQTANLKHILASGGAAFVVSELNLSDFLYWLESYSGSYSGKPLKLGP